MAVLARPHSTINGPTWSIPKIELTQPFLSCMLPSFQLLLPSFLRQVDVLVPMTHQFIEEDRLLAEQFEMHEALNSKAGASDGCC